MDFETVQQTVNVDLHCFRGVLRQLPGLNKCTADGAPLSHDPQNVQSCVLPSMLPAVSIPCKLQAASCRSHQHIVHSMSRHAKLVEISKILDVTQDGTLNYLEFQQAGLPRRLRIGL